MVCNPKGLGESPKMVKSQKWLGEGAKDLLSPGGISLPRVFCTIRNPFCTGATPFCTGATPLLLLGLKDLLHPFLTTFGILPFSGSLPELSDCKAWFRKGRVCSSLIWRTMNCDFKSQLTCDLCQEWPQNGWRWTQIDQKKDQDAPKMDHFCRANLDPSDHLQESPGQKNLRKSCLGVCKKSPEILPKSRKKTPKIGFFRVCFGYFSTFFGYFRRLICRPPKRLLLRLFCDFGPGGQGDSCKWSLGSQRECQSPVQRGDFDQAVCRDYFRPFWSSTPSGSTPATPCPCELQDHSRDG